MWSSMVAVTGDPVEKPTFDRPLFISNYSKISIVFLLHMLILVFPDKSDNYR